MRMTILSALLAAALIAVSAPSGPAAAAEPAASSPRALPASLSRAEEQAIRKVVQGQLDAFAADDAQGAFAFATPAIQKQFGTPLHFMDVVRNGYPVVYRPTAVVFLKPERFDEGVIQGVQMTDEDGVAWLATYRVQRQANKSWRIDGCAVTPSRGVGT